MRIQEGNNIDIKSFDWLTSSAYEMNTSFKLNDYFQKNPQNILGKIAIDSGQFGRPTLTCKMDENIDIQKELDKFVNSLPSDIYKFKDIEIDPAELILNSQTSKQYQENQLYFNALPSNSFVIYNNAIYTKINDKSDDDMLILKKQEYGKELEERIKNFVDLRDKQRVLIDLEKTNILDNDEKLIRARNELNKSYDNYHATKYKTRNGMKVAYVDYLHNRTNNRVLKADPSFARVEALEKNYKKAVSEQEAKKLGIEPQDESAIKASILHTRIIKPQSTTTFSNPVEGLMACMNLYGEPRIDFIAQKLGKSEFDVANELIKEEQIFIDHRMLSTKGESKYIFAPKYLSGDVKRKLKEVEVVAQDYPNEMSHNIKALKGVIPEDIKAGDIEFEMGAPWIPIEYYNQFFEQKFNANRSIWNLSRTKFSGEWNFKGNKNQLPWKIQNEYGLDGNGRSPFDVGLKALENGFFEIMKEGEGYEVDKYGNIKMDKNGNAIKEKVPDPETSAILNSKVERLKGEFKEWLMQDRDRRIDVAQIYNDKFNCYAKTKYDGSFLTLEGLNTSFELRKHQKNAIFRAINDRVCLFDHEVGAGKTLTSICSVMKQKELGIVNKPLFIVPNHLVDQWKNEFFNAYPDANLLIADEKSTSKENKEEFLGRIMADNYDAIIMKHSQFFDISAPAKIRQQIIEQELAELRDVLERKAEDENASRQTIKQIEKRIDNAEERLKELSSMDNKTKMLDFSDLGIDCLVVDESHMFKNLRFSTALKVKGLGNQAGSRKASDLLEKTTWMHENNKKVIFLTGTPISNSLSELYNLNKFLIPDEIEKKEINSFDGWVSSFAQIQLSPELDASAQRYKIVQRLSGLKNLPETCSMYMSYADIVTNADIMQDYTNYVPSVNINKVVSPISKEQEFYIGVMDENTKEFNTGSIIYRMEHMPKDPREDNFLKCTGDAKKAGLDFRLIAPSAKDNKNSKLNKCVENTLEVYKQWEKEKGTQLIFLDSGTPKTSNQLSTKLIIDGTQSTPEATKENDFININDAMNSDENVSDDFDSEAGEDRAEAKETFFLYGDLYKKLVEAGIPRHEIAFIHDTESSNAKKAELFNKVNAGEVRILIGSTAKMGAGTNVQERVVAIHHLDCPWRPSDFVQRNGRVIRQGNKLFERSPESFKIQEFRYVTEKTYDAVSWQIIETKSKSLVNFRKGLVDGRSLSGFEEEAASAAEMKAIATGNPLLILQVKLKTTLDKEEALFRGFQNSYQNNEDELISLEAKLQSNKKYIKNLENIKTFMDKNPMNSVFDCTIHGKEERRYVILNDDSEATKEKQKQMREHFSKAIRSVIDNRLDDYLLCSYNNLQIKATWNDSVRGIVFSLENIENDIKLHPGNLVYDNMGSKRFELEPISVNGFFTRVKNNIDLEKIAENITRSNNSLQETENSIKSAKIWLEENKEYKKMPYLKALRDENKEILSELAKMSNNKNYQSNFKSELFDDEGNEKHQKQREPTSPQTEQQSMRCR